MIIPQLFEVPRATCQNCGEELPCPHHEMKYSNLPKPPPPPTGRIVGGSLFKVKMNYLFIACITPLLSGIAASYIPDTDSAAAGLWFSTILTVIICLIKGYEAKN